MTLHNHSMQYSKYPRFFFSYRLIWFKFASYDTPQHQELRYALGPPKLDLRENEVCCYRNTAQHSDHFVATSQFRPRQLYINS